MYKNQLQELAQRSCFNLPSYFCTREWHDHAPRFKAVVTFNGETFESPKFYTTLRQAEHAAAEVALTTLSRRGPSQSLAARILDETGVCKNLLQENAQRAGVPLPVYTTTTRSGPGHIPVFTCSVEVAGMTFSGEAAKSKKQAEKNAAMVAWSSLKHRQKNVEFGNRVRSFPHIEGNYALHVYIPVNISSIAKKELSPLLKKAGLLVPELHTIGTDLPLCSANTGNNDGMLADVPTLAEQYHISLSRTVAIRVHQIDSIIAMLRHKFHSQNRYWIEFGKWEVFINDDQTRSFLALEVTATGLSEISKQIHVVDEVFRLHNLPEFYKNPRPHISVAWGIGDITSALKMAADELQKIKGNVHSNRKGILSCTFSGVECKIGQKIYPICKMTT